MPRPVDQITKLQTLIRLAQELLSEAQADGASPVSGKSAFQGKGAPAIKRGRRTGKELLAFRKMLKAERKKGIPVTELAYKHGISTAYIYGLD
jgi:hypothetical protein